MNKAMAAAFIFFLAAMTPALADAPSAPVCLPPPPIVATHVLPPYPDLSKRLNEEGRTMLQVVIAANGSAQAVTLARSSGFERLDNAALDFVKASWRWQPLPAGCASVVTRVAINWRISNVSAFEGVTPQDTLSLITFLPMNPADYPADALAAKLKGIVLLAVLVSDKGEVVRPIVIHSSGVPSLDAKALEIARSRHWTPAHMADKPVGGVCVVAMVWTLPGEPVPTGDQIKAALGLLMPPPQSAPPPPPK